MLRAHKRFFVLVGVLILLLLTLSLLNILGMNYFERKPRNFWPTSQCAAGTTSTTGYGVDTSWTHPVMRGVRRLSPALRIFAIVAAARFAP